MAWQARFPDYPAQPANQTPAATGPEYAAMLGVLVPALLAADPSLTLLAVSADDAFNKEWLNTAAVTPFVGAASVHIGYANSDSGGSPASAAAATAQAKLPHTSVLPQLVATRAMLDAGAGWGAHVRISLDEWGAFLSARSPPPKAQRPHPKAAPLTRAPELPTPPHKPLTKQGWARPGLCSPSTPRTPFLARPFSPWR